MQEEITPGIDHAFGELLFGRGCSLFTNVLGADDNSAQRLGRGIQLFLPNGYYVTIAEHRNSTMIFDGFEAIEYELGKPKNDAPIKHFRNANNFFAYIFEIASRPRTTYINGEM